MAAVTAGSAAGGTGDRASVGRQPASAAGSTVASRAAGVSSTTVSACAAGGLTAGIATVCGADGHSTTSTALAAGAAVDKVAPDTALSTGGHRVGHLAARVRCDGGITAAAASTTTDSTGTASTPDTADRGAAIDLTSVGREGGRAAQAIARLGVRTNDL